MQNTTNFSTLINQYNSQFLSGSDGNDSYFKNFDGFFRKFYNLEYKINSYSNYQDTSAQEIKEGILHSFEQNFISILSICDIEIGQITEADKFLLQELNKFSDYASELLCTFNTKIFYNEPLLAKFIFLLSRLPNNIQYTTTVLTIAMGALNHKSSEVREYSIRVFEQVANKEALEFLQNSKVDFDWIQSYKEEVIENLNSKLNKI